ncbi:hypothetical protein C5O75_029005 [Burkholderia cepacia]|uniref:hypothetical protein n=1 Tax=Burkholderia cepacia TaxID=292 RepID=UPI0011B0E191|nr:hypothetical protein [Burkholderia cepacia]KAB1587371.1 hypothetical protein C5O75_029005 [Burkholderia cepacia]
MIATNQHEHADHLLLYVLNRQHKQRGAGDEVLAQSVEAGNHSIHAAELNVSYWPDKSDEDGYARLIAKEDKMEQSKKGGSH